MKKFITVIIILASAGIVNAQFNKAGRTSLQFLKIGIGARQASIGESGIANMNDVNSVFWNPAAIAGMSNAEAAFNYTNWIADLKVMSGAVGYNIKGIGTIALNYISLDYGDLQEALVTSSTGKLDTRTGNIFSGSDLSIGVGIARQFTDKLSIGINVKYLREDLYTYSTSLWAFDLGSYYNTGWKGIRLAMTAQNFSSQARWLQTGIEEQQSFQLPLLFRVGWSIDLLGGEDLFLGGDPTQHKFSFNMDAVHSNDYAERIHMGVEYTAFDIIALRSGYRFNYDEGNFSAGIGLKYQLGFVSLKIDYAYVKYDFLDSPHRFSLIMAF